MKLAAILTLAAILVFWLRRRDFIEPQSRTFTEIDDAIEWLANGDERVLQLYRESKA